jgi:hypothetical protein
LSKSKVKGIYVVVRERKLERKVKLKKDSVGKIGFKLKNGKINGIVKD